MYSLAYSLDRNYTQGEFSPSGTWFWLTIVNALSQLVSTLVFHSVCGYI